MKQYGLVVALLLVSASLSFAETEPATVSSTATAPSKELTSSLTDFVTPEFQGDVSKMPEEENLDDDESKPHARTVPPEDSSLIEEMADTLSASLIEEAASKVHVSSRAARHMKRRFHRDAARARERERARDRELEEEDRQRQEYEEEDRRHENYRFRATNSHHRSSHHASHRVRSHARSTHRTSSHHNARFRQRQRQHAEARDSEESASPSWILPLAPAGYGGPGVINPYSNVNPLNPMAAQMQAEAAGHGAGAGPPQAQMGPAANNVAQAAAFIEVEDAPAATAATTPAAASTPAAAPATATPAASTPATATATPAAASTPAAATPQQTVVAQTVSSLSAPTTASSAPAAPATSTPAAAATTVASSTQTEAATVVPETQAVHKIEHLHQGPLTTGLNHPPRLHTTVRKPWSPREHHRAPPRVAASAPAPTLPEEPHSYSPRRLHPRMPVRLNVFESPRVTISGMHAAAPHFHPGAAQGMLSPFPFPFSALPFFPLPGMFPPGHPGHMGQPVLERVEIRVTASPEMEGFNWPVIHGHVQTRDEAMAMDANQKHDEEEEQEKTSTGSAAMPAPIRAMTELLRELTSDAQRPARLEVIEITPVHAAVEEAQQAKDDEPVMPEFADHESIKAAARSESAAPSASSSSSSSSSSSPAVEARELQALDRDMIQAAVSTMIAQDRINEPTTQLDKIATESESAREAQAEADLGQMESSALLFKHLREKVNAATTGESAAAAASPLETISAASSASAPSSSSPASSAPAAVSL